MIKRPLIFIENQKKNKGLFIQYPSEAKKDVALQCLEENRKKPGGCFQWQI